MLFSIAKLTLTIRLASFAGATIVSGDTAVAAGKTFDYVIVGAGLSGLTVGNKASLIGSS